MHRKPYIDVRLRELRLAVLDDDVRPAQASAVARDGDRAVAVVQRDRHERVQIAVASHESNRLHDARRITGQSGQRAVEEHGVVLA